jgi:hypothetical protein
MPRCHCLVYLSLHTPLSLGVDVAPPSTEKFKELFLSYNLTCHYTRVFTR